MSALPAALPLALSAALYPPALLVLLLLLRGDQPRRLVFAYYCGAAILTIGSGLIALAVLKGANATTESSKNLSGGIYIALGVVLLALAAWAWRRRGHEPEEVRAGSSAASGKLAVWSQRATSSPGWALVLGLAMFLPSPMYLLAVKTIADSGDPASSNVLAVLICAIGVMLFVEVPLIAMFVRPDGVAAGLTRVNAGFDRAHAWLKLHGWSVTAGLALAGAIYAIVKGIDALS